MIDPAIYQSTADLSAHPVVRAWTKLHGRQVTPRRLEILRPPRKEEKSCTFRFCTEGRHGRSVVGKLCLKETAQVERLIYETILPGLPLTRLEYYGTVASDEPDMDWVFVQDGGDVRYSRQDEEHRRLAAEWFATLHTAAANLSGLHQLPDRGPVLYLKHLRSGRDLLRAFRPDTVFTGEQRTLFDRAIRHLDHFETIWNELESSDQNMPRTLIHGDFAGRNARLRSNAGRLELVAFDWELAGRGTPAIDLATSRIYASPCCLDLYLSGVCRTWPALTKEVIEEMARVGRIFRVIAAIDWIALTISLQRSFKEPEWLIKPISELESYLRRIDDVLREPVRRVSKTARQGMTSHPEKTFLKEDVRTEQSETVAKQGTALSRESGLPGSEELYRSLQELLGVPLTNGSRPSVQALTKRAYRLCFPAGGPLCSVIVKRLDPDIARRNSLVAKRWLPAIRLGRNVPSLLGVAAEREGQTVWHIYEDLGNWDLRQNNSDPERVRQAVELIARLHARFVEHPWLAECRLWGADLGVQFYSNSVRDAIANLERLKTPDVELSKDCRELLDRLLRRLDKLQAEWPRRLDRVKEFGGPETLLHGDLWPQNALVVPSPEGPQARLIDWDHAGVGPVMYDLSTLLSCSPPDARMWMLNAYRQAPERPAWAVSSMRELNLLFETAEYARLANCVIWPAIQAQETKAVWAFEQLNEIDEWFEALAPPLPM